MDAEPQPPMVLHSIAALTWARARSISDSPGGWGRFLASVLAAMWAVSLWSNGEAAQYSGTGEMVALFGVRFTFCWMIGLAVVPMIGLLLGWLPLRVASALISQFTWVYLLIEMGTHGHLLHLSAGSCVVGVLACARADVPLWIAFARRYQ